MPYLEEPMIEDVTDGRKSQYDLSEYLAFWGSDRGDQAHFYNYGSEGDKLEYLKNGLLPVLERQIKELSGRRRRDKRNLMEVKEYIVAKIAALEKGEETASVAIESESLTNGNGVKLTYSVIRKAMKGKPFDMHLKSEYPLVARAVNQGIDARLQACFVPERGDRNDNGKMIISVESFPVLVRRLFESQDEESETLAEDLLTVLGFDENGKWEEPKE